MKDRKKDGKQKHRSPGQNDTPEGPRRKRLKPVSKAKYKINRYQLSEDLDEEEDDLLYEHYADEED